MGWVNFCNTRHFCPSTTWQATHIWCITTCRHKVGVGYTCKWDSSLQWKLLACLMFQNAKELLFFKRKGEQFTLNLLHWDFINTQLELKWTAMREQNTSSYNCSHECRTRVSVSPWSGRRRVSKMQFCCSGCEHEIGCPGHGQHRLSTTGAQVWKPLLQSTGNWQTKQPSFWEPAMRLRKYLPSLIVYVLRLLKESIENVVTMHRKGKSIPVNRWNVYTYTLVL